MSLEVWDYVFLQSDHYPSKCGIPKATLDCLRAEFQYWYPVDVRMSGKDLVQNHLTYFIYCHTAMWPKDKSVSTLSSLSFCCLGWGCSSVGRASDQHAADAGSIPQCGKGFFFLELTFSADSLMVSVHPRVQSHAFTSVRTLKIPWSMSEFGGLWLKH